jgi:OOP family OmpA-OmpF porin
VQLAGHRRFWLPGATARGFAAATLAAAATSAQPLALQLPKAPAGDHAQLVAGADARGDGALRARASFEFVHQPLVLVAPDQQQYVVVERQTLLDLGASFALRDRFLFALELPLLLEEGGGARPASVTAVLGPAGGSALGDPRVSARARLLGAADAPEKLGLGVDAALPLGGGSFSSEAGARVHASIRGSSSRARGRVGFELGYFFRNSRVLSAILPYRLGSALTAGVAGSVPLDRYARFELAPELQALFGTSHGTKLLDPRSTSAQALISARYLPASVPVVFALGGGPGFGQRPGSAEFRLLASVTFSPEGRPPPPDADEDDVPDARDACPQLRGSISADPLMNGCPEVPVDTDGDAIPDMFDACPRAEGPAHRERRLHGCPPPIDRDADGIDDPIDACPDEAGIASSDATRHGCPAAAAKLVAQEITLSEQVQFETGTADLKPASAAILNQVKHVLLEHPELELVEIQGHTDDTGTDAVNRSLSEQRAQAVASFLVSAGIEQGRLVAKGYGAERPLADNTTDSGRAKNRRVEFHVLRRGKAAP